MPSHFNDIQAALETHLSSFAANNSIDVAWRGYETDFNATYLRPTFLPASTAQVSLGATGMDSINGIYQIDLFRKKASPRSSIPDSIADHFSRGLVLTFGGASVRLRTASIAKTIYEEVWSITPVSISWETYLEAR